jgi:hypothetical protein
MRRQIKMNDGFINSNLTESNTMQFQKPKTRTGTFVFSLFLAILGVLICGLSELLVNSLKGDLLTAFGVGMIAGKIIGTMLIISIVAFIIFRIKSINIRADLSLIISILFILAQIVLLFNGVGSVLNTHKQEKASEEALSQILKSAVAGEKIYSQNYSEEEYGINAPMLKMSCDLFNNIIDERVKYEAKANTLSSGVYLDRKGLSSDASINESIGKFKDFKETISSYQSKYEKYIKDFEDSISKLDVPEDYKKSVLKGYKDGVESDKVRLKDFFKIENEFCDKYVEILEFLKASRDSFKVQNNVCVFSSDNKLNKYNKLVTDLKYIVGKEEAWTADNQQRIKDILKKYDDLTK